MGKSVPPAEVNASRVEAPVKLNCRKTLFLFLARKHVFRPLSLSLFLSAIVAQSRFLPISASTISLVLRQSTLLPFSLRPPFILSLFLVFAQLTRVSICFIKLRRAPFYSSLLFHSRRDISTSRSPSSTNIPPPPLPSSGATRDTFLSKQKYAGQQEGEPPLRPSDPSTLSYKFNTARSFPACLPPFFPFSYPRKVTSIY